MNETPIGETGGAMAGGGGSTPSTETSNERKGSFKVIYSNRLEFLTIILAHLIRDTSALNDPYRKEEIIVSTEGMKKYVEMELAKINRISADSEFPRLPDFLWSLMSGFIEIREEDFPELMEDGEKISDLARMARKRRFSNYYDRNTLVWRVIGVFLDPDFPIKAPACHKALRHYLYPGYENVPEDEMPHDVRPDDARAYALANQIALLFEQYIINRDDWMNIWHVGGSIFSDDPIRDENGAPLLRNRGDYEKFQSLPAKAKEAALTDEAWQAELWRLLRREINTPSYITLWKEFSEKISSMADLSAIDAPERVFIFSINSVPIVFLDILKNLSRHMDINLFCLNPCQEYWGDITSNLALLRKMTGEDAGSVNESTMGSYVGHPLLANLGQQGRDFFEILNESEEIDTSFEKAAREKFTFDKTEVYMEAKANEPRENLTLLELLQRDILTLSRDGIQRSFKPAFAIGNEDKATDADANPNDKAKSGKDPSKRHWPDDSIILNSTHSPVRELEILKDELIEFFDEHPECGPNDVVILNPNIEEYAPYIDAIFSDKAPDGIGFPYSVADRQNSRINPFLSAIGLIFDFVTSRFEKDKVLPILLNKSVMDRFNLDEDETETIKAWIENQRTIWGWDEHQRAEYGDESELYTWKRNYMRVFAGAFAPIDIPEWKGITPYEIPVSRWPTAIKYMSFLTSLRNVYLLWQKPTTVDGWTKRIRDISELIAKGAPEHAQSLSDHLAEWTDIAKDTRFDDEIGVELVKEYVTDWLNDSSQGQFLNGGITFCNLIPMRNIPFQFVGVLGLNDGDFPRRSIPRSFDLMDGFPRKGDKIRMEDDRYLFLECVLSARRTLYLSYVGHNEKDNAPMEPSMVVHDLAEVLSMMVDWDEREKESGELAKAGGGAKTPEEFEAIAKEDSLKRTRNVSKFLEKWRVEHPLHSFSENYFKKAGPTNPNGDRLFSYRKDHLESILTRNAWTQSRRGAQGSTSPEDVEKLNEIREFFEEAGKPFLDPSKVDDMAAWGIADDKDLFGKIEEFYNAAKIAIDAQKAKGKNPNGLAGPMNFKFPSGKSHGGQTQIVGLDELASFWKNPQRAYLKRLYNYGSPFISSLDDEGETFNVDKTEAEKIMRLLIPYHIKRRKIEMGTNPDEAIKTRIFPKLSNTDTKSLALKWFEKREKDNSLDIEGLHRMIGNLNLLPSGEVGKMELERFHHNAQFIVNMLDLMDDLRSESVDMVIDNPFKQCMDFDEYRITGSLGLISGGKMLATINKKPAADTENILKFRHMAKHALFVLSRAMRMANLQKGDPVNMLLELRGEKRDAIDEQARQLQMVLFYPGGFQDYTTIEGIDVKTAISRLKTLLAYREYGLERPLPFHETINIPKVKSTGVEWEDLPETVKIKMQEYENKGYYDELRLLHGEDVELFSRHVLSKAIFKEITEWFNNPPQVSN